MARRSTIDVIFIVRQLQEKYLANKKDQWMTFVDLEKAFVARVPREVVWWALRYLGVDEWIVMMEALSREFRAGLPMKLLYADYLVLIAETKELLLEKVRKCPISFAERGCD